MKHFLFILVLSNCQISLKWYHIKKQKEQSLKEMRVRRTRNIFFIPCQNICWKGGRCKKLKCKALCCFFVIIILKQHNKKIIIFYNLLKCNEFKMYLQSTILHYKLYFICKMLLINHIIRAWQCSKELLVLMSSNTSSCEVQLLFTNI